MISDVAPTNSPLNDFRQIRELHLGTSQPFGLTIVCVVQAFAGLGLALRTNWKLALVVLSAIPIIAIGATVLARGLQADTDRQNEELTKATKRASNCITNIVTVKCFNTQEQEATTYAAAVQRAAVYALKQTFRSSLQIGFVRFATTAMFVQGECFDVLNKSLLTRVSRLLVWWHTGPYWRDNSRESGHDVLGLPDSLQGPRGYIATYGHTAKGSGVGFGIESSHHQSQNRQAAVAQI